MKSSRYRNKYLLFDDRYTERKSGFKTTVTPARQAECPLVVADSPWERAGLCGDSCVTVLKRDGIHRMWYSIRNPEPERRANRDLTAAERERLDLADVPKKYLADILCPSRYYLCYATSEDGLRWEKGHLGIYEIDGNRDNNIVFSGRLGATVFVDPNAPPDKRYRMIHGGSIRLPHWHRRRRQFMRMAYTGIYGACSADGIHWQSTEQPIMPWYTDTTNVCYWDEAIGKYVAYVRRDKDMDFDDGKTVMLGEGHNTYRIVARSESADFENFPPPVNVLEPEPEEVEDYFKGEPCRNGLDFYSSAAVKYPFADDAYLLFPSYFYHEPDTLDVHIATSRNGVDYMRHDEPFLALGRYGDFDARQLYMATGMIGEHRLIHMYYLVYDKGHDAGARSKHRAAIGRVSFPVDRFIAQHVQGDGTLTTVPVEVDGRGLQVNVETSGAGFLRAALLNPSGEAIEGREVGNSDAISGDHSRIKLSWRGVSDLSSLRGRTIAVRFVGRSARLYSFEWSRDSQ